jgi:hypothetical protein
VLFVLIDALPVRIGDIVLREDLSALAGRASPMPQSGDPG